MVDNVSGYLSKRGDNWESRAELVKKKMAYFPRFLLPLPDHHYQPDDMLFFVGCILYSQISNELGVGSGRK